MIKLIINNKKGTKFKHWVFVEKGFYSTSNYCKDLNKRTTE